jgi:hypothetical protein
MNEFERKWQEGAAAARRATPEESPEAPLGFATRVVAQWRSRAAPSLLSLWQGQAWRTLKVAVALLVLAFLFSAAAEMDEPSTPPLAAPAVEETVTDAISML